MDASAQHLGSIHGAGCISLPFRLHPHYTICRMHLPVIRAPSSVQDASAFIQAPSALTILQLQPAIRAPSSVPDVHACRLGYIHATRQSHRMHLPAIWAPSSLATPVTQDASAQSCHELHPHWGYMQTFSLTGCSVLFAEGSILTESSFQSHRVLATPSLKPQFSVTQGASVLIQGSTLTESVSSLLACILYRTESMLHIRFCCGE